MEKCNRNLAIIPARSGSKGLKDKNIKLLNGKPLIAYTIEAAKKSGLYDTVFVSTDSIEYAEIAKKYGAEVPFLRSDITATDTASSWDVVRETLQQFEKVSKEYAMLTLLQPTSPLRNEVDIRNAYQLYLEKNANSIVSVCEVDHSPLLCNVLPEDGSLKNFLKKDIINSPRQSLSNYYRINGAIYMINVEYFRKCNTVYDISSYAYIMSRENSIDIDNEIDFRIATAIMEF